LRRPQAQPSVHGGEPVGLCAVRQYAGGVGGLVLSLDFAFPEVATATIRDPAAQHGTVALTIATCKTPALRANALRPGTQDERTRQSPQVGGSYALLAYIPCAGPLARRREPA